MLDEGKRLGKPFLRLFSFFFYFFPSFFIFFYCILLMVIFFDIGKPLLLKTKRLKPLRAVADPSLGFYFFFLLFFFFTNYF